MKNKLKEFLTKDEASNVLRQPNQRTLEGLRDYCILSLMIQTGLRRAELCNLKRGSLIIGDNDVHLQIFGKGMKWRSIPISDTNLLKCLGRYFKKVRNNNSPEAPMFYNLRSLTPGNPQPITWATVRYLVPKYLRMAGIHKRITPHSLRHTFLTLTLQAGADLGTVRDLAGHSNVSVTSTYLHTTEERKKEAIERLRL